jgi:hypothetical protein
LSQVNQIYCYLNIKKIYHLEILFSQILFLHVVWIVFRPVMSTGLYRVNTHTI